MLSGDIDTTYHTVQRDLFTSGLAAQIGVNAFATWSAIKVHADFENGLAWPSVRKIAEMTGLGNATVMRAIDVLEAAHLLRKEKAGWPANPIKRTRGRTHTYVARERLDVRLGSRVLCTIVVDYVPLQVHKRIKAIRDALAKGDKGDDELWAQVDIIPGEGFAWDPDRKILSAQVPSREIPPSPGLSDAARAAREQLRLQAAQMRRLPKK